MANILIIDDSESFLEWIAQRIAQAGHKTLIATDGQKGLSILRRAAVDLIITDICMPDLDGFGVLNEVRRARPGVPLIAISAQRPGLKLLPMAKALGAGLTLQKPFSQRALLHAVNMLLKRPAVDVNARLPVQNRQPVLPK